MGDMKGKRKKRGKSNSWGGRMGVSLEGKEGRWTNNTKDSRNHFIVT